MLIYIRYIKLRRDFKIKKSNTRIQLESDIRDILENGGGNLDQMASDVTDFIQTNYVFGAEYCKKALELMQIKKYKEDLESEQQV